MPFVRLFVLACITISCPRLPSAAWSKYYPSREEAIDTESIDIGTNNCGMYFTRTLMSWVWSRESLHWYMFTFQLITGIYMFVCMHKVVHTYTHYICVECLALCLSFLLLRSFVSSLGCLFHTLSSLHSLLHCSLPSLFCNGFWALLEVLRLPMITVSSKTTLKWPTKQF